MKASYEGNSMEKHARSVLSILILSLMVFSPQLYANAEKTAPAAQSLTPVLIGYLNDYLGLGIEESQVISCTLNQKVVTIVFANGSILQLPLPD